MMIGFLKKVRTIAERRFLLVSLFIFALFPTQVFATSPGSGISGIWQQVQLNNALQEMVDGAGSQVAALLPVGVGILFILAIPRIIRRVLNTFL